MQNKMSPEIGLVISQANMWIDNHAPKGFSCAFSVVIFADDEYELVCRVQMGKIVHEPTVKNEQYQITATQTNYESSVDLVFAVDSWEKLCKLVDTLELDTITVNKPPQSLEDAIDLFFRINNNSDTEVEVFFRKELMGADENDYC